MTTTRIKARYVIGYDGSGHRTLKDAEVVYRGDSIVFVGRGYGGPVDHEIDGGNAVLGPGFIDLNALADLDTTVLAFDNQPDWAKGRVWPEDYLASGPVEMYSTEETTFKMKYAFVQLIRNGITTALPITSMFYRAWAETYEEFERSADSAAEVGIRAYLGPCYMTGVTVIRADGSFTTHFDEARGLRGLDRARDYIRKFDGAHGGLVRGMLSPDRIENCTPELIRRTAAISAEFDCPVKLHCCQGLEEFHSIVERYDKTPMEWLASLDFLSRRALLPHGVFITGHSAIERQGDDAGLVAAAGATFVHCPLVLSRYGGAMESFIKLKKKGISIGLGTDTFPPDMVENMRIGIGLCRVAESDVAACSSADFYNAATIVAADAIGRPDLGRLAVGAKADMTLFDLSAFELGQVIDPIQTMMLSGTGRDFKTAIVNGRTVMRDRQLPGIDLDDYRRRAQSQFDGLIAKYPMRTWRHPPVEEIFSPSFPFG
ncbi:MAG: amidohydrolase family protein [Parvibaculaceae bacterium]